MLELRPGHEIDLRQFRVGGEELPPAGLDGPISQEKSTPKSAARSTRTLKATPGFSTANLAARATAMAALTRTIRNNCAFPLDLVRFLRRPDRLAIISSSRVVLMVIMNGGTDRIGPRGRSEPAGRTFGDLRMAMRQTLFFSGKRGC
ncbi:hypothetical protein ACFQ0B_16295 [Nonomuraea thailandensis]